jgi:hypothetical protein
MNLYKPSAVSNQLKNMEFLHPIHVIIFQLQELRKDTIYIEGKCHLPLQMVVHREFCVSPRLVISIDARDPNPPLYAYSS